MNYRGSILNLSEQFNTYFIMIEYSFPGHF